jgi:hypothetical protein
MPALRRLRQDDCDFKASLGYIAPPPQKKKENENPCNRRKHLIFANHLSNKKFVSRIKNFYNSIKSKNSI